MTDILKSYFPALSDSQTEAFATMARENPVWNEKINVVSRKDIDNIVVNHILHSLAIAKFIHFADDSTIIDLGTGGGFPGIPLAVMYPKVKFHLIDRIGKKLKVAADVAEKCGLTNVSFQHGDMGECKVKADFVVSRAVMPQPEIMRLVRKNISTLQRNAIPNGIITLKGGNLTAELASIAASTEVIDISSYFKEPFFETKKIVYSY